MSQATTAKMNLRARRSQQQQTKKLNQQKKDTVMKTKHNLLTKISLCLGLAVALAFASGCATTTSSGDGMKPMKGGEHQIMLPK